MDKPIDMIGQEISIGSFVAYYSNVYEVLGIGRPGRYGHGPVRILLVKRSKTTRPVTKQSHEMAVLNRDHVLSWMEQQ